MKKLLIIVATHGDEKLGCEVVIKLADRNLDKFFDVLIANPDAMKLNKRFIDKDLNRAYPGNKNSKLLESRLAYENLKIAKKYQYVIDIHEAAKGRDNFIIIPRKKLGNAFPLTLVDMNKILFWPEPKGPLGGLLKNTIELEFGVKEKDRKKIITEATNILAKFIGFIEKGEERQAKQEFYRVYGFLTVKEWVYSNKTLKDFKEIFINSEYFLPLLTDQYLKERIKCYKMKKIKKN